MGNSTIFVFIDDITSTGGTERVAALLVNGLVGSGKILKLVSLECKGEQPGFELSDEVEVVCIRSKSIFKLGAFLKRNSCDKIISISMGRLSFKITLVHRLLRLKSQLILSEHTSYEASKMWVRAFKSITYQFADFLILLTKHDYNLLHKRVRSQCRVITNSSTFPKSDHNIEINKKKIVLAVGRLNYGKGFDRLIDIWASIDNNMGWKLRIVGDGEEYDNLKRKIILLGLSDSVSLVPFSNKIESEYVPASIIAMTSRFEGLPLVLIESKSFAIPAISFDCKTGPRELIENNVDGFLIPDGNNELYRNKLVEMMSNNTLLKRMQLASLSSSEKYSADMVISKWLDVIGD